MFRLIARNPYKIGLAVLTTTVAVWATIAQSPPDGHAESAPPPTVVVTQVVTEPATEPVTPPVTSPSPTPSVPSPITGPSPSEPPAPTLLPSPTAVPTASPSPTPTPTPTATRTPRNKAHGLRDGCLIDRHWLLLQPCKVVNRLLSLVHRLVSAV